MQLTHQVGFMHPDLLNLAEHVKTWKQHVWNERNHFFYWMKMKKDEIGNEQATRTKIETESIMILLELQLESN